MEQETTLSNFLQAVSNNIGFSISEKKKPKESFNPFAVNNTSNMCLLYSLLRDYSEKEKSDILIPKEIVKVKDSDLKVKFPRDLDNTIFTEILDKRKIDNIDVKGNEVIIK